MRNKRFWLIMKGILILLFTAVIVGIPTQDTFRKWLRFIMLVVFVVSFLIDLNNFNKSKKS